MKHPDRVVLILGCGYLGTVLAQRLAFKGRPVVGTTRSDHHAVVIRSRGAQPLVMDTTDLRPLDRVKGRVGAVVDLIGPAVGRDGSYDDATRVLMQRLAPEDLAAFVYVSSTGVYGDQGGGLVDESTPCRPDSPRGSARLEIEQRVLGSALPAMVVRPAGIYGPGRSPLHRIAAGQRVLIGDGAAVINRIHVHDLAALLEAVIDGGQPGQIYLAADERPASHRELTAHVVDTYGLPEPPRMSLEEARVRLTPDAFAMLTGSKRIDASASRRALGLRLRFGDYVAGLADIWQREAPQIQALIRVPDPDPGQGPYGGPA